MKLKILDYLKQKGIRAKQITHFDYRSSCPICGGIDCFFFWSDRNRYMCQTCNKSGDLVDLIRRVEKVNFEEACEIAGLAEGNGPLNKHCKPNNTLKTPVDLHEKGLPAQKWVDEMTIFACNAQELLLKKPELIEKLRKTYGINDDTAKKFKIGWHAHTDENGQEHQSLTTLLGKGNAPCFPEGFVIPSYSADGRLLRISIAADSKEPNLYVLPGSSMSIGFFGELKPVHLLAESELDCILLQQECGDLITTASTGRGALVLDEASYYILLYAKTVVLSFKTDIPGRNSTLNFLDLLKQNSFYLPVIARYGASPSEAFKNGLDLRHWLNMGLDYNNRRPTPWREPKEPEKKSKSDASKIH